MVDPKLIPESTWMDLAESLSKAAKRFFQDPENQKAYEKWAAERRAKLEQAG